MGVLQLKRGLASRWRELNPVLEAGEPGFSMDENKLKIGDGKTHWNDLLPIGESCVFNANTHYDFPSIGKEDVIYKAESEKLLYQWNTTDLKYEIVGEVEVSGDLANIEAINGGSAINV